MNIGVLAFFEAEVIQKMPQYSKKEKSKEKLCCLLILKN